MEIVSYALSFIATVLGLCEPFGKKMKTILIFNFSGNLLVGISYLAVVKYSGAAICLAACVQVLINYCFDVKHKKIPGWLIAVYMVVFAAVNIFSFTAWYDCFSFVAAMLFVLSVAQSSAKYYRLLYVTNSMTWIVYDFFAGAYGNLFTHIALFVGTALAIFIRDLKQKKNI